eukprot:TRINITY_DN5826_c1_g1_i3.p1 TRINITY_DN5826_c1_g1~~TRINITY_DN5826_c1_g1_i3.p1  ORF type:complete len:240 (+),score=-26.50 TRINITY_DN5826_c1_g1_i3:294-1013(+)
MAGSLKVFAEIFVVFKHSNVSKWGGGGGAVSLKFHVLLVVNNISLAQFVNDILQNHYQQRQNHLRQTIHNFREDTFCRVISQISIQNISYQLSKKTKNMLKFAYNINQTQKILLDQRKILIHHINYFITLHNTFDETQVTQIQVLPVLLMLNIAYYLHIQYYSYRAGLPSAKCQYFQYKYNTGIFRIINSAKIQIRINTQNTLGKQKFKPIQVLFKYIKYTRIISKNTSIRQTCYQVNK